MLAREEIFRAVLVAIPWSDEEDVVRMANDSHYGLAAYIWAHDRALRTAHAIEAGWLQINQGLGHSYGGYKQSGIGREFSLEGMLESFTLWARGIQQTNAQTISRASSTLDRSKIGYFDRCRPSPEIFSSAQVAMPRKTALISWNNPASGAFFQKSVDQCR
jgi:Aldehyde dehydrogenase family